MSLTDPLVSEAGTPSGLRHERSLRAYDGVVNVVGEPKSHHFSFPKPLPTGWSKRVSAETSFYAAFRPPFRQVGRWCTGIPFEPQRVLYLWVHPFESFEELYLIHIDLKFGQLRRRNEHLICRRVVKLLVIYGTNPIGICCDCSGNITEISLRPFLAKICIGLRHLNR
jgi:hypothetical protein